MYVTEEESRLIIRDGYFLYASDASEKSAPSVYPPDARTFMKPSLFAGEETPSFGTDIYSACAIMWTLLNGNWYTQEPDTAYHPLYSEEEITELLIRGMTEGEAAYRDITNGLHNLLSRIRKGEVQDREIHLVPPPWLEAHRERVRQELKAIPEKSAGEEPEKKNGEKPPLLDRLVFRISHPGEKIPTVERSDIPREKKEKASVNPGQKKKVFLLLFLLAAVGFLSYSLFPLSIPPQLYLSRSPPRYRRRRFRNRPFLSPG